MDNELFIANICILTIVAVYTVVSRIAAYAKAKKLGIVRVKFPIIDGWFVCYMVIAALALCNAVLSVSDKERENKYLYGLQTRGVPYYEKVNNTRLTFAFPGEEERFLNSEIAKSKERLGYCDNFTVISSVWAAAAALVGAFNGVYITKKGVMKFGSTRVIKTVRSDGKKLLFCSEHMHERPLLRLRANNKNMRLYSEFIIKEPRTEQI